ncbi:MAG: site-specific DNA-methyltransferase [[Chlorobium] sp. 445]|nr:MAG: site-specific DNA-methyltransferase [[Chlorobium] sp. 445]
MPQNQRAERNRTLTLTQSELVAYSKRLKQLQAKASQHDIENSILHNDLFEVLDFLPEVCVDLLILDPPYNLTKSFNGKTFKARTTAEYIAYLESWLPKLLKTLKPTASLYLCGEWRMSAALQLVLEKYLIVRNRITWEREKGRAARRNWKNCSEDIWFCTLSDDYVFNAEAVKLKRKVLAPYRENGLPKDWEETAEGNFRLTAPSNLWTDITVPFWSMPENTEHPTQKPEKLIAKLILASSNEGDLIFDPFLGSGTTAVVAKKLNRRFVGIEKEEYYACLAAKRLDLAEQDKTIQGYHDGVFWERNSLHAIAKRRSFKSLAHTCPIDFLQR